VTVATRPLLLFVLWATWLSFPLFAFGSWSWVNPQYEREYFLTPKLASARSEANGTLGAWNSQWLSGVDRAAVGFEIDKLLYRVLPGWLAHGSGAWLRVLVAGYFGFRLLRDSLGVGAAGAIFAGLAFSSSGFAASEGLGPWALPFCLWALARERGALGRRAVWALLLGFGLTVTFVYAYSVFILPAIAWWLIIIERDSRRDGLLLFIVFCAGWLAGSFPLIWAHVLHIPWSHRVTWDWTVIHSWAGRIALVRDFAIDDAIPLAVAAIAWIAVRGRDRRLDAVWVALLVFAAAVPVSHGLQTLGQRYLGWATGFNFAMLVLVLPFWACVAGGVGVDLLASRATMPRPLRTTGVVVAVAIALVLVRSVVAQAATLGEMARGGIFAVFYAQPPLQRLAEQTMPLAPFRVATICDHPGPAWAHGLDTADGQAAVYPRRYKEFWAKVIEPVTMKDARIADYFHSYGSLAYLYAHPRTCDPTGDVRMRDYYNLTLLSLANVRYVIARGARVSDDDLTLVSQDFEEAMLRWQRLRSQPWLEKARAVMQGSPPLARMHVYENRGAFPRFFVVGAARRFDDSGALLTALGDATAAELRTAVYVARSDVSGLELNLAAATRGEVTVREHTSDRIRLAVAVEGAHVLVVAQNWSPYWQARIDDRGARIFPAYHAFQGIYIPGGRHDVVLTYDPPYPRVPW
jgi:hypothetical protein